MAGARMTDPDTGLPLTVLDPAPASWSQDSVRGRMMEPPPMVESPLDQGNPFLNAIGATPALPNPDTAAAANVSAIPVEGPVAGGGGSSSLRPSSLLDKVLFAAFGTPDSKLSPEEESAAHGRRSDAAALSKSAATNPGEAHMGIPSAGGTSMGEALQFLPQLMKMLGGLG